MNKSYNFLTDQHVHSPVEFPRLGISEDRTYSLMLVPRRPSPEYKFLYMHGNEVMFKVAKTGEVISVGRIITRHYLKDYQYWNPPTKEIREYPCVIMEDKIKKRISRRNYMDWKLAVAEFEETIKVLNLMEITPKDSSNAEELENKIENQKTLSNLQLPWWKKLWNIIKGWLIR